MKLSRAKRPARIRFANPDCIAQAVAAGLQLHGAQRNASAICAISLGAMLSMATPLQAATFTVTNTTDADPGSLRAAIISANTTPGADEIVFDAAVTETITLTSGQLDVTDPLTISGPGASMLSIDANNASRVLFNTSELEISGLTLSGGNAFSGGGILSLYGSLSVTSSTISDNSAAFRGGGIDNKNGTLTVNSSTISGNTADHGGGIYSGLGTMTVTSSTISGNTVVYNGGGVFGFSTTLTVNSSTISGNIATSGGGIHQFAGFLTVNSSTISGNSAPAGGGIYTSFSNSHTINGSTISSNTASIGGGIKNSSGPLTVNSSTISGNTAEYSGGGIYNRNGTLAVNSSTISGNIATSGGGIANIYGVIKLGNSIITNQLSGGDCYDLNFYLPFTSNGNNIDSDGSCDLTDPSDQSNTDPLLGPLADNGGPTFTHALLVGSPAIDAIPDGTNGCGTDPLTDQRGETRPQDGDGDTTAACDIGAYEVMAAPAGSGVIGNFVWHDTNQNGRQDDGEPGFVGVTVNLWQDCNSNTTLTTTTDSEGAFSFNNLPVGDYQLAFVKPAGYVFSPAVVDGDYRIDSNPDENGLDACRPLADGQVRNGLDAGLYADGSGPVADTLTVVRAIYYPADKQIWIKALSDALPAGSAVITATAVTNGVETELGQVGWKAGKAAYQQLFKNLTSVPDTIILNSAVGGMVTAPVEGGGSSSADTLTINKAIYYTADNKLWIKADSDASPAGSATITAVMVINGVETVLGQVGWKADKAAYQQVFKNIGQQPDSVILNSNLGGTVSSTVSVQ